MVWRRVSGALKGGGSGSRGGFYAARSALMAQLDAAGWRLDIDLIVPEVAGSPSSGIDLSIASLEDAALIDFVSGPPTESDERALKDKAVALRRHHTRLGRGQAPRFKRLVLSLDGRGAKETLEGLLEQLDMRPAPLIESHSVTIGRAMESFRDTLDELGRHDAVLCDTGEVLVGELREAGELGRVRVLRAEARRLLVPWSLNWLRGALGRSRVEVSVEARKGKARRAKVSGDLVVVIGGEERRVPWRSVREVQLGGNGAGAVI